MPQHLLIVTDGVGYYQENGTFRTSVDGPAAAVVRILRQDRLEWHSDGADAATSSTTTG